MINVYPIKIEAYDEDEKSLVFTIEAIDAYCAEVQMRQPLTQENIDNVVAAMRRAVAMLELKTGSSE